MDVKPLPYDENIGVVKILDNPKVIVGDFVDVMEDCFSARALANIGLNILHSNLSILSRICQLPMYGFTKTAN